jgi:hypothetical protein
MLHGTFVFLPFLETDKEATIMPTSVRTNFQSLKEIQQAAANVAHSVRNKFIGTDCRIETEERMSRRIKASTPVERASKLRHSLQRSRSKPHSGFCLPSMTCRDLGMNQNSGRSFAAP